MMLFELGMRLSRWWGTIARRNQVVADDEVSMNVAIEAGNLTKVESLIRDMNLNFSSDAHKAKLAPFLSFAVSKEKFEIVEYLVDTDLADLNHPGSDGHTAVHVACSVHNLVFIQYLYENGGNIHALTANSETTLMLAAMHDNAEVVKFLLEKGVVPDAVNKYGESALQLAIKYNFTKIVTLIGEEAPIEEDVPLQCEKFPIKESVPSQTMRGNISTKLCGGESNLINL